MNHSKKWDKKKEEKQLACFECEKTNHYKSDCPIWKSREENNITTSMKHRKGMICIHHLEEDEDSSSSSSISDEEVANICLMARSKQKNSDVSDYDSHYLPIYNELSEALHEIYDDASKYSLKRKIFWDLREKSWNFKMLLGPGKKTIHL